MSAPALRTAALGKRYGDLTALDGVEISVQPGEVYGFLGRNGAGKSTTIRLLLGLITPTSGHAEILGTRVGGGRPGPWRRVGYLVDSATAYPDLTVRDNLEVSRLLHGVPGVAAIDEVIERLDLGRFADRRAGTLSTGNLQRLALARALLHEPELLILDEPTAGLDPAGVVEVRELLRALASDRGVTVFLSSHILPEVERIASRVGIIHQGRLVTELSASELNDRRRRRLEVGVRDGTAARAVLDAAGFATARAAGSADDAPAPAATLILQDTRAIASPDLIARVLVEGGVAPTRLAVVQEDMESFFLSLTGTPT